MCVSLGSTWMSTYTYWNIHTEFRRQHMRVYLFSFPLPWSWTKIIRFLCRSLPVEVCFPFQPFIFYSGIIHTFIHSWRKITRKWSRSKCSCSCFEESTGHRECPDCKSLTLIIQSPIKSGLAVMCSLVQAADRPEAITTSLPRELNIAPSIHTWLLNEEMFESMCCYLGNSRYTLNSCVGFLTTVGIWHPL